MKQWFENLKRELRFLGILNSPFILFNLKWYFGKIAIGVPIFYPRKWVKFTKKDALELAQKQVLNQNLVYYGQDPNDIAEQFMGYQKPVYIKIGFSFCGLGYKTKWSDTDYRYEWSPVLSFVFFGYQIAITVFNKYDSHYWESWLYYRTHTDKTKSTEERVIQCMEGFPNVWTSTHSDGREETINYYTKILKKKYLHLIK